MNIRDIMDYLIKIFDLFVSIFKAALSFKWIILLVTTSGVVGGLVTLLKSLLDRRNRNE